MTTLSKEPGLAYVTRPDGRVRGTLDGKHVTIHVPDVTDDAAIVRRLREEFGAGRGQLIAHGMSPLG